jgi:hypothetical protein
MYRVYKDLADITQRIDDSEKRAERARARIVYLATHGYDTQQARALLDIIQETLRQLYQARAIARRHGWVVRNGDGACSTKGSAAFMVVARYPITAGDVPTEASTSPAMKWIRNERRAPQMIQEHLHYPSSPVSVGNGTAGIH